MGKGAKELERHPVAVRGNTPGRNFGTTILCMVFLEPSVARLDCHFFYCLAWNAVEGVSDIYVYTLPNFNQFFHSIIGVFEITERASTS